MQDSYATLCSTPSSHDAAIQRDLARTLPQEALFREKSGKGQSALFRLLRALAVHLWDVGYVQSLNFVIATLICVFPEDEELVFHCAQALLFRYHLVDFYRPRFPKLGVTVWQFDRLVEGFLPKVYVALHRYGVTSEYYAMQWFLTLFASDLPQPVVHRIWDRFLVAGWTVIAQVGLALLYDVQDTLATLDSCEALTFLKRFTRKRRYEPEALLQAASNFDVSHRMLSELEAAYSERGSLGAAPSYCSAVASCASVEEGGDGGEDEQREALPAAQLVVAKDLQSGEVAWHVQRRTSSSTVAAATEGQRDRRGSSESAQAEVAHRGDGTMLPFLFHNLDTGETCVLEEEWDEYLRESQRLAAAEAGSTAAATVADGPAARLGQAPLGPHPFAGQGGVAFWLEGMQQQAMQVLQGRS